MSTENLQDSPQRGTCVMTFSTIYRMFLPDGDDSEWEKIKLFHAGFACGQAEKIFLGACQGAMFRPPSRLYEKCLESIHVIAHNYKLAVRTNRDESEIWMLSNPWGVMIFEEMMRGDRNSPEWHLYRGMLCGLPIRQTDFRFHERLGYGQYAGSLNQPTEGLCQKV